MSKPNCLACSHCYLEPDAPYPICGHKESGSMGLYIKSEPLSHCGWQKFEKHPLRNSDGSPKRDK